MQRLAKYPLEKEKKIMMATKAQSWLKRTVSLEFWTLHIMSRGTKTRRDNTATGNRRLSLEGCRHQQGRLGRINVTLKMWNGRVAADSPIGRETGRHGRPSPWCWKRWSSKRRWTLCLWITSQTCQSSPSELRLWCWLQFRNWQLRKCGFDIMWWSYSSRRCPCRTSLLGPWSQETRTGWRQTHTSHTRPSARSAGNI